MSEKKMKEVSRKEVMQFYYNNPLNVVLKTYNMSRHVFYKYLTALNIPKKGSGKRVYDLIRAKKEKTMFVEIND